MNSPKSLFQVKNEEWTKAGSEAHKEIVVDAISLAPRGHDPSIVEGNDDDLVDALGLELLLVVDVGGEVRGLASRSESTRD